MKINLAGYNLDSDVIEELKALSPGRLDATPETLSASYARISRDPRSIDELRKAARSEVESARKSNKTIIFKMGHHSVAEHAVFNFDVIGISRLAMEYVEHFRLCSFTEKSQRYITLGNNNVIPQEIKNSIFAKEFKSVVDLQNDFYHRSYEKLRAYIFVKNSELAMDAKNHNLLEGWAKEDARYITSLATEGQLGLTVNARNLELMLRRFASNQYAEVREIGKELYRLATAVAPSIILFTEANDYDSKTYDELSKFSIKNGGNSKIAVSLEDSTKNADDLLVSAIMHTVSNASLDKCRKTVSKMSSAKKIEIVKASMKRMEFYDATLREFEHVSLTYDMVISASCFAQLKRHRTATLTTQDYAPSFGVTVPQAIVDIKLDKEFKAIVKRTEELYYKMKKELGGCAQYILTNAHRRRVLMGVNARELYHISRLREDAHAQWDIQNIAAKMAKLAKKKMPLTFMLIGGKDKYTEIYEKVYGVKPKLIPPK
jgi:flavin-dependent thymidylate synthase